MNLAIALAIIAALLAVISLLCWKLSRVALEASILSRTISNMLGKSPVEAERIARDAADRLRARGLWRS